MVESKFAIRAPGKTILFGEHAVVYGVPAIAASVGLHSYLVAETLEDRRLVLNFPAVNLSTEFNIDELPWSSVHDRSVHHSLSQPVVDALRPFVDPFTTSFERATVLAFLYLYVHIAKQEDSGWSFLSRASLPIGSGLGSSAAFTVVLAATFLYISGQLDAPAALNSSKFAQALVNSWSYLGECCIHGNPSGIDNFVSTYGGAVRYQKNPGEKHASVQKYSSFPTLKLILTDTNVSRSTSELVSRVEQKLRNWPTIVNPILEAITGVVESANSILKSQDTELSVDKLQDLVDFNQCLLAALEVSHPTIEKVREITSKLEIGATKLTGAGGGGCTITIGSHDSVPIDYLRTALGSAYTVFETTLGGPGVSICFEKLPPSASVEDLMGARWQSW